MFPLTLNSEVKVKKTDREQNNGKISQKLVFLLFYARYRAHEDNNTPNTLNYCKNTLFRYFQQPNRLDWMVLG